MWSNHIRVLLIGLLWVWPIITNASADNNNNLRRYSLVERHPVHPLFEFADFIRTTGWYERMLSSPDFIKVQDIARRLWASQTGQKHKKRIRHTRRLGKSLKRE